MIAVETWLLWLVIAVLLAIAEMFTGTFYLLWIGISCMAAGIVGMFVPDALWLQLLVAAVVGILLTINTKRLTKRFTQSPGFTQNPIDALKGKTGIVLDRSESGDAFVVKVGSETWSAKADEPVAKGDRIAVLGGHSTILHVKKVD
jgi:membrane protein implicated in regulation of membrane protease activity